MPLKCNGYMTLLFVKDIKRSRDFYENVLGLEFEHGNDDSATFILGPEACCFSTTGARATCSARRTSSTTPCAAPAP